MKKRNSSSHLPTKKTTSTPTHTTSTSLGETIKSGFGFGVGSSLAHGIVGSLFYPKSNEPTPTNNESLCSTVLKDYMKCLDNTYTLEQEKCQELRKLLTTLNC